MIRPITPAANSAKSAGSGTGVPPESPPLDPPDEPPVEDQPPPDEPDEEGLPPLLDPGLQSQPLWPQPHLWTWPVSPDFTPVSPELPRPSQPAAAGDAISNPSADSAANLYLTFILTPEYATTTGKDGLR
jgi:hypothetical protein